MIGITVNTTIPVKGNANNVLSKFLSVRFLKLNRLLKTGIILTIINIVILVLPMIVKPKNPAVQYEIDGWQVLKANFLNWSTEIALERNVTCIVFLTMLALAAVFLIVGIIKQTRNKNKNSPK